MDRLRAKARAVAADFIGYPVDEEDKAAIEAATPMQAINALECHCHTLRAALEAAVSENRRLREGE